MSLERIAGWGRHGWMRIALSSPVLGLALAVLLWPGNTLRPTTGLDPSWQASLSMAFVDHIPLGTHPFVFGPLGFLIVRSLWHSSTAIMASAFLLTYTAAILGTLVWALRKVLTLPAAVVVAFVVGGLAAHSEQGLEYGLGAAGIWCVAVIGGDVPRRWLVWWWPLMGATAGTWLLVKRDVGTVLVGMLVVTLLFSPAGSTAGNGSNGSARTRLVSGAMGLSGFLACFAGAWFATGNSLGGLPTFARGTYELMKGYAGAMAIEARPASDFLWAGLACGVLTVLVMTDSRLAGRRARAGAILVVAGSTYAIMREEFVAHNDHAFTFFAFVVLLAAGFRPSWHPATSLSVCLAGLGVALVVVVGTGLLPTLDPLSGARAASNQIGTLASASRRDALMESARHQMQRSYALPRLLVDQLRGHSVFVDPWAESVLWAYPGMRFDPLPVLQDYSAYTPWLDNLDARALAGPGAPERILRRGPESIEGRDPFMDPPNTQLAIMCHYGQLGSAPGWQVLARIPDRCGPPKLLATVSTGLERRIEIPYPSGPGSANDAVAVSIDHVRLPVLDLVLGTLMKPPVEHLVLDGTAYRLVTGTAADLHLLRAPAGLGWAPAFTPPTVRWMSVRVDGLGSSGSGVQVSFYAVPYAPVG